MRPNGLKPFGRCPIEEHGDGFVWVRSNACSTHRGGRTRGCTRITRDVSPRQPLGPRRFYGHESKGGAATNYECSLYTRGLASLLYVQFCIYQHNFSNKYKLETAHLFITYIIELSAHPKISLNIKTTCSNFLFENLRLCQESLII